MKRFATTLLAGLTALTAATQAQYSRPRLVVGIVVDQLRTDYIDYLREYFGRSGFNTLLNDGVFFRDVEFEANLNDASPATAMLYTGAYPSETGVPSASVYNASTAQTILPLAPAKGGSVTNDSFTPSGLRLTTIGDELALTGGAVYSVAPDPQQAVVMAGHAGKGAYWINNTSGNWATTTYYGALPSALASRNSRRPLAQRIDTMKWGPSSNWRDISWISKGEKSKPFRHTLSRRDRDVYKKFAATPMSNAEVTDVAIELLGSLNLGSHADATDMLNLGYTAAPYTYDGGNPTSALADTYLRLDAQIGRLIEAIDRRVGRGNAVIWLTSTGYYDEATTEDERYRLPGGDFSIRKAKSLLNSYLSARHGNAQYVAAIRDGQVYLDHNAIEALHLDAEKVTDDARTFLMKMSGVADALTLQEVLSASSAEGRRLRASTDPSQCGDVFLRFTPGWSVHYDEQTPPIVKQIRSSAVATPAFILAPELAPATIDTPVEAVRLAPTLAGALRIRAPSGAGAKAIPLGKKGK